MYINYFVFFHPFSNISKEQTIILNIFRRNHTIIYLIYLVEFHFKTVKTQRKCDRIMCYQLEPYFETIIFIIINP